MNDTVTDQSAGWGAILTEGETPYDERCTVRLTGKAGPTMQAVLAAIPAPRN